MYFFAIRRDSSFVKIYAINSSITFSLKAQPEIALSNRVASYYDLKPLVNVSFNSLQLANNRVSRARGIDSTAKGDDT